MAARRNLQGCLRFMSSASPGWPRQRHAKSMAEIRNVDFRTRIGKAARPRVLLVEDEPIIGYATMADLADQGFDLVLCFNGRDGLAVARAEPFDLVVTDLEMPGMSGLDMIVALRLAGATMPIILTTAVPKASLPEPGNAVYDRVLSKPYRSAEIATIARCMIDSRCSARSLSGRPAES